MKRQTYRIIVLCLMGLAAAAFIYLVRSLLAPFVIAILLAYLIYPLVRTLEPRGVSRANAILTVYAAGIILAGIFLLLVVPTLFNETRAFENILPVYSNAWMEAQGYLNHLSERVLLPPEGRQILLDMSIHIRSGLYERLRSFAEGLLGLIALLPSFLLAPFIAYYMIKDFEHFKKRLLAMLPSESRGNLINFLQEADLIFSKFLRGHVLVSIIVGFLTGLGAALIGLQFFLLIGIFTAMADLIPFFGPIIAAFPVVGLALVESRTKGVLMLLVFLVVQQIEGAVLAPRLLGERMGLHPLAVVLVLLIGGYYFGPLGMIFAVPVTCLLRVGVQALWDRLIGLAL
ncbi:MAG: AI-2E family transporter [Thermacetogeniaceae bacterium]